MFPIDSLWKKSTQKQAGFSLLEALIGISLLTLSLMGVFAMMAYFGSQTSDRTLKNCLLDSASSALSQYRANVIPVSTPVTCRYLSVDVSMNRTTFPAQNTCNDVTATAAAWGKSLQLTTNVCNFQ